MSCHKNRKKEIEVLRYVNEVSCNAHIEVMQTVKPGMMEYQLEALFQYHVYNHGGCRNCSYTCICASGSNSSILHYGHSGAPNDRKIEDGEMLMFDMGSEYHCYGADISRSYPSNGRFTEDQKMLYEIVLAAQENALSLIKPGVNYLDIHLESHRIICDRLKENGFLKGHLDDMMKHHIGYLFMPHGLGHFLGLDTHDVGGFPRGLERYKEKSHKSVRIGRILEEGMCLTVEPGLYFNQELLESAFKDPELSKFLVTERISQFFGFGGIRIEDDIIVTKDGIENLTGHLPKTVEEIERIMSERKSE